MIGLYLLSVVCVVGAESCDLYERGSWVEPTTDDLRTCLDRAAFLTSGGTQSRCEVGEIDAPRKTSASYKPRFQTWTF